MDVPRAPPQLPLFREHDDEDDVEVAEDEVAAPVPRIPPYAGRSTGAVDDVSEYLGSQPRSSMRFLTSRISLREAEWKVDEFGWQPEG